MSKNCIQSTLMLTVKKRDSYFHGIIDIRDEVVLESIYANVITLQKRSEALRGEEIDPWSHLFTNKKNSDLHCDLLELSSLSFLHTILLHPR